VRSTVYNVEGGGRKNEGRLDASEVSEVLIQRDILLCGASF